MKIHIGETLVMQILDEGLHLGMKQLDFYLLWNVDVRDVCQLRGLYLSTFTNLRVSLVIYTNLRVSTVIVFRLISF